MRRPKNWETEGAMKDEFDYDLTPGQWEALKALRTAASPRPRISRYALDSLIALGLIAMNNDTPVITTTGRKVLVRGSSQLLLDLAA
jgi:ribosomal protein S19E (S16A)